MNIADLARVRNEDVARDPAGQASGAGARALMDSIMSEEREPAGRPRRHLPARRGLVLGAAAVGLAAALAIGVGLPRNGPVTEYANAAVSLKRTADYLTITVNDPDADAKSFSEAFRAVGLDATVDKIPVPPQMVGKMFGPYLAGDFPPGTGVTYKPQHACGSAWCGEVVVPAAYTGKITLSIGREAAPGEPYAGLFTVNESAADFTSVDGYPVRGKTVAEVRTELARRGLKIRYVLMQTNPDGSGSGTPVTPDRIRDDYIVTMAMPYSSDTVRLHAGPDSDPLVRESRGD
ncbi:hypothetical protein [Streptosporangium lutulentum]|uniref:PASTA domain-containing protein n=1 Tax=Streptosporangium lutulentum TaxID=1461250 RepID=A0ABT9QIX2_9ACTN|nr:hypothetical protein [Streptosporangium lutulentum]MDP9846705.1 hypothetical protein [Streptosporangium lutulentum]